MQNKTFKVKRMKDEHYPGAFGQFRVIYSHLREIRVILFVFVLHTRTP